MKQFYFNEETGEPVLVTVWAEGCKVKWPAINSIVGGALNWRVRKRIRYSEYLKAVDEWVRAQGPKSRLRPKHLQITYYRTYSIKITPLSRRSYKASENTVQKFKGVPGGWYP